MDEAPGPDAPVRDFYDAFDAKPAPAPNGKPVVVNGRGGDTAWGLKALALEASVVASSGEGTRNDTLNAAAFRMGQIVGGGNLAIETAADALASAARAVGLGEREIATALRLDATGGLARGALNARVPEPLAQIPTVTTLGPVGLAASPTTTASGEADFWDARPVLAHLHLFARARMVAPWAVLGSALARTIVTTHKSIALPPTVGAHASLNLFVAIVGRSGSGKGAADAVAREALKFDHIETRNAGSGEGLVHAFVRRGKDGLLVPVNDAVLFNIPEVDSLGAVGARQGATILSMLRQAWSGEQLGFQYADATKSLIVEAHRYRMALIAGVQPGRAGAILDDLDGGLPQRFSWLRATDPEAPAITPDAPDPMPMVMRQPLHVGPSGFVVMDVCTSATETIRAARLANARGQVDALDGHALLTRLKTAAAFALMEQRLDVSEEDWQLSGVVAAVSDATRASIIAHREDEVRKATTGRALAEAERQIIVGETVAERAVARVARGVLRRLPEDGSPMLHSDAVKALASRDREYFEDALGHLARAGQIEVEGAEKGTVIKRSAGAS